ncbi:MAG: hypothetical protein Q8Q82_14535 [Hydrogenophaga sp.]|nr:hypothetical protein [Hydrogenophaga sp.]
MTSSARDALEDCRGALQEFVDGVQGRAWKRRWITCVVLLRAVGHVLDKVDGDRSPRYRREIDSWWENLKKGKPEPAIFWAFIEQERNSIVKEYRTRAGQGVTVPGAVVEINRRTGEQKVELRPPAVYQYTINAGPFAGRDQRELVSEAILWWQTQLDAIDAAANAA